MAVYSPATDIQTRRIVWVGSKVKCGTQIKHKGEPVALSAAELSNLSTDYEGWQGPGHKYWHNPEAKRISFPA
jgi:hypothetical protein